jgi:hypothetical protein
MTKLYQNATGVQITLETGYNIAAASALTMAVKKPDATTVEWTATLSGTTALRYVTAANDLDQAGEYFLQAKVTVGALVTRGETAKLVVSEPFA